MSSIKTKIIGFSIIYSSLLAFILMLILVIFEVSGLSEKLSENTVLKSSLLPGNLLIKTDYYGSNLKDDPYENFTIQHLHPYYLFSLPWRKNDILSANNDIVNINNNGFRVNPFNASKENGLLLGGSTAFGHFSSSDKETLAYHISKNLNVNIINRNAPSWNSHQELVALTKMQPIYKLSISLSLANDIALACVNYNSDADRITDQPESFDVLASYFNDLRAGAIDKAESETIVQKIKKKLKHFFPETYKLANLIKLNYFKSNSGILTTEKIAYCNNYSAETVADSFLKNQKAMSRTAKAIGAKHYLILQPQIEISNKEYHKFDSKNGLDISISRSNYATKVYEIVMSSDYCKSNPCFDLTKINLDKINTNILFNAENNDTTAFFADNSHLLDTGVRFFSSLISDFISLNR